MIKIDKCPICGSEKLKAIFKTHIEDKFSDWEPNILDIDYVRNYILFKIILRNEKPIDFTFWLCGVCGFIFFSPRPGKKDMSVKYQFINEVHDSKKRETYRNIVSQADRRASHLFRKVTQVKTVTAESRILDLGGGTGSCLKEFALNGCECHVVDLEKRSVIPSVKYLCSSIDEIPKNILYDVILFCHTLEHMVDPYAELVKICSLLTESGLVYIEVPFGCGGEYLRTKNFLTHINFFSTGSLGYLLESSGFAVTRIKAESVLSNTRYLPVVWAIAEKTLEPSRPFLTQGEKAYQITEQEMRKNQKIRTAVKNAFLVFHSPLAYLKGYRSRLRRKASSFSVAHGRSR